MNNMTVPEGALGLGEAVDQHSLKWMVLSLHSDTVTVESLTKVLEVCGYHSPARAVKQLAPFGGELSRPAFDELFHRGGGAPQTPEQQASWSWFQRRVDEVLEAVDCLGGADYVRGRSEDGTEVTPLRFLDAYTSLSSFNADPTPPLLLEELNALCNTLHPVLTLLEAPTARLKPRVAAAMSHLRVSFRLLREAYRSVAARGDYEEATPRSLLDLLLGCQVLPNPNPIRVHCEPPCIACQGLVRRPTLYEIQRLCARPHRIPRSAHMSTCQELRVSATHTTSVVVPLSLAD